MQLFEAGAGLPDAYPFMRHIISDEIFIIIALNRQHKKVPLFGKTAFDELAGNSAAAGDNAQFFMRCRHVRP